MISIVSNSYYGMPRGQIHINLPPEHPIMSSETIEIKMAAVSAKRSMVASDITQILIGYVSSRAHFNWLLGNMSLYKENLFQSKSK